MTKIGKKKNGVYAKKRSRRGDHSEGVEGHEGHTHMAKNGH